MKTAQQILTEDRLWRVRDVAHFLQVSTSWVYKAAELGTVPSLRIGAALRFDPEAVKAFVRGGGSAAPVVQLRRVGCAT